MSTPPEPRTQVRIFTDGACTGNPGPGGWGAILIKDEHRAEISGGEVRTTNNRMEMLAAIKALQMLKRPCNVVLHTDSQYLVKGATIWIDSWKRKGWKKNRSSNVKNVDLWKQLDDLRSVHSITWKWVKGHSGITENERADKLARKAIPNKGRSK